MQIYAYCPLSGYYVVSQYTHQAGVITKVKFYEWSSTSSFECLQFLDAFYISVWVILDAKWMIFFSEKLCAVSPFFRGGGGNPRILDPIYEVKGSDFLIMSSSDIFTFISYFDIAISVAPKGNTKSSSEKFYENIFAATITLRSEGQRTLKVPIQMTWEVLQSDKIDLHQVPCSDVLWSTYYLINQ